MAGVLADIVSIEFAILMVAGITAASGPDVSARMGETLHRPPLPVVPESS